MGKGFDDIVIKAVKNQEEGIELMEELIDVAHPSAVYSEPVTSGDYTVITASEVSVGMGFGYGLGGGISSEPAEGEAAGADEPESQGEEASGFGGGGGGGGLSVARPVAAISIGPDGVWVEPVMDRTKIALAFFTTLGSMLLMLVNMRKASRR